jgi:3-hydroxyisobutyrate dehydrogenase-like beta-hydroxyacid dehydrogenase/alkylhydroperoxidase/carboxymuconolactone decarboxylase family protein YurZ
VIGLGMIGGAVAATLAGRGFPPTVFDVRPDAVDRVDGVDTQVATPADVARASDVVMLAVVNAQQAEDVLVGADGVLTAGREDLVVVLLSTVSLTAVHHLADLCAAHGATLLDAGVTQAGGNQLVVMLGGDQEDVERATPVIDAFAKAVVHCGELGAGMVTKLARNVITYSSWAVLHEAVSIAAAGGVTPERLLEVIRTAGAGGPTPTSMLESQVADGPMPAERIAFVDGLAQKDLAAAQEFAGASGLQTPIVDVVRPTMPAVLSGRTPEPLPADRRERGLAMMERVYGDQLGGRLPQGVPALDDTVEHLFGDVWSRAHLTTRDRRLLALGATTTTGRQDLLEVQLRGALRNGEFTTAQLREIELFLNYYTGVENGSSILTVIEELLAERAGSHDA